MSIMMASCGGGCGGARKNAGVSLRKARRVEAARTLIRPETPQVSWRMLNGKVIK
jgi:hypothetical protein